LQKPLPSFPTRLLVVPPITVVAVLALVAVADALGLMAGGIHGTAGATLFVLLMLASLCALLCELVALPRAVIALLLHAELRSAQNALAVATAILFMLALAVWFLAR
jgi:RsiW-degrading membrane proteinase PrsW (M82 family)